MIWITWPATLGSVLYVLYRVVTSRRLFSKSSTSLANVHALRSPKPPAPQQTGVSKRSLKLDTLPFDVCVEIFAYLSVRDLCVIERSSKPLFRMVRHRHTWSHVVADIHQVKPLAYHIDLLSMTADELRAMAIRAVKLHHAMGREFRPQRVSRVPLPAMSEVSRIHPYPRGRCIVAGKFGELFLFSTQDGCYLDNVPRLYHSTPEHLGRAHLTVPVVISASRSYLLHVMNCEEYSSTLGQPRRRFKEGVIRIFSIEDCAIRLLRELQSDCEIVSVSASSTRWAYLSCEEKSRNFFVHIFPLSNVPNISSEGVTYVLQFLSEWLSSYPVTMAFTSDQHLMLADNQQICVYLVPDSSSAAALMPVWQHFDDPPDLLGAPRNPRVAVAVPSSENLDTLRFSLYWNGHLRTIRLPESNSFRAVDIGLEHLTIYSLGTTSVIIPEYSGAKHYHSISFLYASSPNQCTNRLECSQGTLVVHGDLRLFVDGECHLPRALCLDEESGLLVAADFDFIYTYAVI